MASLVESRGARVVQAPAINQAGETRSLRVESLRALAALGVVVGHCYLVARGSDFSTFGSRLGLSGGYGVWLFFALSGYLLYLPFARRDFSTAGGVDYGRYAANRILRILPLYYFALVLFMVVNEGGGYDGPVAALRDLHGILLAVDGRDRRRTHVVGRRRDPVLRVAAAPCTCHRSPCARFCRARGGDAPRAWHRQLRLLVAQGPHRPCAARPPVRVLASRHVHELRPGSATGPGRTPAPIGCGFRPPGHSR